MFVLWGTGKIASILLEETSIRGEIDCVIDNDVSRQGKKWNGYSVVKIGRASCRERVWTWV